MKQLQKIKMALACLVVFTTTQAQVQSFGFKDYSFTNQVNMGKGSGQQTNPAAWLEIGPATMTSTRGVFFPRGHRNQVVMTGDLQQYQGLVFYDVDDKKVYQWNGSAWEQVGGAYSDETARDAIGAALVSSSTITWDVNDATNQITASVPAGTFAPFSGGGNYIQNGTTGQTASFNITGTGKIVGALTIGNSPGINTILQPVGTFASASGTVYTASQNKLLFYNSSETNYAGIALDNDGALAVNAPRAGVYFYSDGTTTPVLSMPGDMGFGRQHRVGINNSAPTVALDVTGDIKATGKTTLGSLATAPALENGALYYNTTSNTMQAGINGAWKKVLASNNITTDGGTYVLDVNGGARFTGSGDIGLNGFTNNVYLEGNFPSLWFSATSGHGYHIGVDGSNMLEFRHTGSTTFAALAIAVDGKIGVNTTAPAYTLDVNGTARIRDKFVTASLATAPTVENGALYYNTTSNTLQAGINGAWQNLVTGNSSDFIRNMPTGYNVAGQTATINVSGTIQTQGSVSIGNNAEISDGMFHLKDGLLYTYYNWNFYNLTENRPIRISQGGASKTIMIFHNYPDAGQEYVGAAISDDYAPAVNNKAVLTLTSTKRGFLTPRMTTTQRDAITSPAEGMILYNLTTHHFNMYNGNAWRELQDL